MYGNKKIKVLWTVICLIGILAMLSFTVMPAFQ
jgi:hypothetical protein